MFDIGLPPTRSFVSRTVRPDGGIVARPRRDASPFVGFFCQKYFCKTFQIFVELATGQDIICRIFDRPHRILTQLRGLRCVSRGAAYQLSKKILKYF
jgi:hypothetical protein